jgi:Xaa-Pro aminopeptidase
MKIRFSLLLLVFFLRIPDVVAQIQGYYVYDTDLMSASVFKERREKLMREMGDSSVAFLFAGPERKRNNDVEFQYRQDDDFYYLTGMNEPNSIAALIPAGMRVQDPMDTSRSISVREILFVQPRDSTREMRVGRRMGPEGAMAMLGFQYALENTELRRWTPRLYSNARVAYVPYPAADFVGEIAELARPLREGMAKSNTRIEVRDPSALIARMRAVKSPEEIAMIQKAIDISCVAHRQAMMSAEPGMYEYELQAIFEYVFRREGAEYSAYPCIVGSGENSVILHYNTNRRKLNSGDIVVMDCGAEYHNYAADVTRTIPASGTFTDAQREIYEIVLQAQEEAVRMIKPGADFRNDVQAKAAEVIQDGLLRLGIIRSREDYRRFFTHGIGHPVGLWVHDVGGRGKLEPGMIWTVEPGIYIPDGAAGVDPKYYSIGIRIEDCVLVTENGSKLLSAAAPRTVEEIERLMKKRGIGNESIR